MISGSNALNAGETAFGHWYEAMVQISAQWKCLIWFYVQDGVLLQWRFRGKEDNQHYQDLPVGVQLDIDGKLSDQGNLKDILPPCQDEKDRKEEGRENA